MKKKHNSPRIQASIRDDSGICGLWGNRASLPSKVWDALTWRKNCWLSPLLPPSPTSPDPGDGVLRSKFNFFPVQHQHNPTPPKIFVPGHHVRIQEIFCQGCVCVCVGGGSSLINLFYSLKRGSNVFITHFPWGGRVQLFPGVGSNRNPYNYNLWFSRGSGPPIPPLHPHMDIVAFWHE